MRVLIFGNRGFIGSSLAEGLKKWDFEIISCDTFEDLIDHLPFVDVMINCVGRANVRDSFSQVELDFCSNFEVVRRLLIVLTTYNTRNIKFINFSSAAVYGNPKLLPIKESDLSQPLSPYGYHKYMAEMILKEYSQIFGLQTLSLRVFSAYGNKQKKLLLWDLHEKIRNSKDKIVLYGTGNESRDFIHVEDISQQVFLAINNADFQGEAINVANGVEIRVSEIVELYRKFYPKKFDYEFSCEIRLGDPINWCADISLMEKWGYLQEISIKQGIEKYISWALNE
jgi:UDP-glucose 4-epimerase